MGFTFTIYALALFAGFVVTLVMAAVVWTRHPAPGIIPLALLMIAVAIWILASAFEVSADEIPMRIICNQISYLGVTTAGVFWLIFTLDYFGSKWWRRPLNLILISVLPLITLIIVWTNGFHHLEWANVYLIDGPLGMTSVWEKGPLYWLNPITQYLLYLSGIVILFLFGTKRKGVYGKQVGIILAGTMIPVIGDVLYAFRVDILGGIDITPFCLVIASIFYSVSVWRFRFPDVVPVAYKAIVKNIPDGFLVLDHQGLIVDTNTETERIISQDRSSLQGKAISGVWPELNRNITGLSDRSHIELSAGNVEKPIYLDIGTVTLYDGQKNNVGKLVVLRDITDLKNAHKELEVLYGKEHELVTTLDKEIIKRSQYTRALVHELGTPLTSIIASTELLEDLADDPIQAGLVKNILRSAANLEHRVNELLDLARGELGILKIQPELLDLSILIQEIVSEINPLAVKKGIKIRQEISETGSMVMADKKRIRQVITNLLSNSLKFTSMGEIVIRDIHESPDFLKIQVEDTGIRK
jgi:PAS domain S-box-containing protein